MKERNTVEEERTKSERVDAKEGRKEEKRQRRSERERNARVVVEGDGGKRTWNEAHGGGGKRSF